MGKSNTPGKTYWDYLYFLVLLPCLVYTLFYTARAIFLDYTPVPFWDSWRTIQYLDPLYRFDLRHFWIPHNEHRIVFPETIYALDYLLFRGVQLLPIACNILCQLGMLALLCRLLWRLPAIPLPLRLALAAGCSLFLTSAMQVQGFLGTFELQWYLSELAAALASFFLWRSAQTGRKRSFVASLACAIVVTYSTSNGMAIWLVLVGEALLLRMTKLRVAIVAAAGVFSIAVYFIGYPIPDHSRTAVLLAHPFYALRFMAVFLGTPISYASPLLGAIAGFAGLLLTVVALLIAWRRRFRDPSLTVTAGLCLYIAASALLIAYGRMDPRDRTFTAALAQRYVSVPLTYCASLTVVIAWLVLQLRRFRRLALHLSLGALSLLLLAAVVRPQQAYESIFRAQQARGHETAIALAAGIQDPDLIRVIFPDPPFVIAHLPAVRSRRLSIFASGRQDWIGQPLLRVFHSEASGLCSGSVDHIAGVAGGYRATGWALDNQTDRPPRDIVLVNPEGAIVGFGESRPGGYPDQSQPSDRAWVAFARTTGSPASVRALAVMNQNFVCPLVTASVDR